MYTRLPKTSVSIVLLANIYLAFNPNPKQRRENVQGLILFLKVNVKRPSCQGHLSGEFIWKILTWTNATAPSSPAAFPRCWYITNAMMCFPHPKPCWNFKDSPHPSLDEQPGPGAADSHRHSPRDLTFRLAPGTLDSAPAMFCCIK